MTASTRLPRSSSSTRIYCKDLLQGIGGSMTRLRAKRTKQALHRLLVQKEEAPWTKRTSSRLVTYLRAGYEAYHTIHQSQESPHCDQVN